MKAFLKANRHWIAVEELPPYAYDLNPCEALWAQPQGARSSPRARSSPTCAPTPSTSPCKPRKLASVAFAATNSPSASSSNRGFPYDQEPH